jgi:hypothetical protein
LEVKSEEVKSEEVKSEEAKLCGLCVLCVGLLGALCVAGCVSFDATDARRSQTGAFTNELSRLIDITPNRNMTRMQWMAGIVMTMLLYGRGNAIVVPHTYEGIIRSLEPIASSRVSFLPVGGSYRDYRVVIDGVSKNPSDLMHFAYNPDPVYLWKGQGVTVTLKDIADNLAEQARIQKEREQMGLKAPAAPTNTPKENEDNGNT